jgi:hypothetical protein
MRSLRSAKDVFQPLESRARLVTVFFWCYVAISAVAVLAGVMGPMIGVNVNAETALPGEDTPLVSALLLLWGIALILYVIVLIVCAIVFLMWLYRARRNLPALGVADVRWSPGWSIAWWFIPIMSLFRPYQVVKETWRASDPTSLSQWSSERPPGIYGWWWGLFLVYGFVGNATDSTSTGGTPGFDAAALIDLAGLIVGIGSALCAMWIVRDITARQTQRHQVGAFA